jgi:hypothetical protein
VYEQKSSLSYSHNSWLLDWLLGKQLMKKLLLLPILFILSACQPSELERCVKANIPDVIVPDNQEIISGVLDAYEIVFSKETKQQYKDTMIAMMQIQIDMGLYPEEASTSLLRYEGWKEMFLEQGDSLESLETGINNQEKTIADLIETAEGYEDAFTENNTYPLELYFKNLINYNIEYYGLTDENILKAYFEEIELTGKETATSICNAQGIY